ncbi:SRPBCC domain-containing protein, partial [Proteiniclasticum ruminis]
DGSEGFDFTGTYDEVVPYEKISYTMDDDRRVWTTFTERDGKVFIESIFEAENTFPVEMQKEGWQSILNRYKAYTESQNE